MKLLIFLTALLLSSAAYAEGNEEVCRADEKSCLAQVLAEHLIASEMRAVQVEAHTRFLAAQSKDAPKPNP